MGSAFAGAKAGIIGGIFFAGSLGIFNYLLLVLLKPSVLAALAKTPECSGVVPSGTAQPVEDCFTAIVAVLIPLSAFIVFILSLVFAIIYGKFFESYPGRDYRVRALIVSYLMLVFLLLFGLEGIFVDEPQRLAIVAFDAVATGVYAYLLGKFYKRYTRVIEFSSPEPEPIKIMIGRKNVTGKTLTFSTRSSHKVVARASEKTVFREWSYSGGVTVEDPNSFETIMRVDGDGMLKATSAHPS